MLGYLLYRINLIKQGEVVAISEQAMFRDGKQLCPEMEKCSDVAKEIVPKWKMFRQGK